ncbi:MAG: trimethylamine methyltransferase family protein [Dehalococcoidia bacterium]|nr:trimethylamine methyltransferase family protein [Dehalococcoidia bacterium]
MSRPQITFLSEDDMKAIHNASLKVLEKTGVKVMSNEALDILKRCGAKVDHGEKHASIPGSLVEEALRRAPKTIRYAARNPKYDFILNKQEPHFCVEGMPPFVLDGETGKRRNSTSEDVASFSVIADYLDHVDLLWPAVVTTEVSEPMQGLTEFMTCLRNTGKHVEHEALNASNARYQIEITSVIVGGREALKRRPIISAVACTISPLTYDGGIIEGAIEYGKAGIPVVVMPMPMVGTTGPVTLAGAIVANNAEFLGNLVILEFANSGAPVVYSAGAGVVDFRTGSEIASPEGSLMHLAISQLTHYYDLPNEMVVTGGTTSKLLDMQAGYERARTILTHILIAPDIALGIGGLERDLLMSPEVLVIDNEIIDYALKFMRGFEVNNETLAVDVINRVGPGGIYLGEKHTLEHFRERWMSRLSDIDSFETWQKKGAKSIAEVAREKVKEILATHKPAPIPEGIEKEISWILKRAEAELR